VYYSDLASHTSTGLNASNGARVFTFNDGAFTPVVADDQAIFLIGHGSIYEMLPSHRTSRRSAGSKSKQRTHKRRASTSHRTRSRGASHRRTSKARRRRHIASARRPSRSQRHHRP
jgi:hypothetical protein